MDIAGGESRDDGRTVHMEAAVKQRVRFSDNLEDMIRWGLIIRNLMDLTGSQ